MKPTRVCCVHCNNFFVMTMCSFCTYTGLSFQSIKFQLLECARPRRFLRFPCLFSAQLVPWIDSKYAGSQFCSYIQVIYYILQSYMDTSNSWLCNIYSPIKATNRPGHVFKVFIKFLRSFYNGHHSIHRVNLLKYIGVIHISRLYWSPHLALTATKGAHIVGILRSPSPSAARARIFLQQPEYTFSFFFKSSRVCSSKVLGMHKVLVSC